MGKIYTGNGWFVKVHGNDHLPVHAHVFHVDGKAVIGVNGSVINSGVPARVIALASAWIADNTAIVEAEWEKMNNPR